MKPFLLGLLFSSFISIGISQSTKDSLTIYFENDSFNFDQSKLNPLSDLPEKPNLVIWIEAYADSNASSSYNRSLSHKRAYFTYYQLINFGAPINAFSDVTGKGEITNAKNKSEFQKSRRVVIKYSFLEEPIEETANSQTELQQEMETEFTDAEAGDYIKIENIHFQPGTHLILPESIPELAQLVQILKKQENLKIEIQGHICCQYDGRDGYDAISKNNQLSVNRAYAIYRHLIDQGIEAARLSFKGFGSSRKLYQNEMNDLQKIANRRVEIYIIEK